MSEQRDAKKDLAVCEAATPGPWTIEGVGGVQMDGKRDGYAVRIDNGALRPNWTTIEDAEFVVVAREALPHWINRAVEAEAREGEYREALEIAVKWMRFWLDQQECDCPDYHTCGRYERERELEQMEAALSRHRPAILDRMERLEALAAHLPECPADVLPPEVFGCDDITGCHGPEGIKACWRRLMGVGE